MWQELSVHDRANAANNAHCDTRLIRTPLLDDFDPSCVKRRWHSLWLSYSGCSAAFTDVRLLVALPVAGL